MGEARGVPAFWFPEGPVPIRPMAARQQLPLILALHFSHRGRFCLVSGLGALRGRPRSTIQQKDGLQGSGR
eukprot:488701-Pyramimonas_sp.AAC.1